MVTFHWFLSPLSCTLYCKLIHPSCDIRGVIPNWLLFPHTVALLLHNLAEHQWENCTCTVDHMSAASYDGWLESRSRVGARCRWFESALPRRRVETVFGECFGRLCSFWKTNMYIFLVYFHFCNLWYVCTSYTGISLSAWSEWIGYSFLRGSQFWGWLAWSGKNLPQAGQWTLSK